MNFMVQFLLAKKKNEPIRKPEIDKNTPVRKDLFSVFDTITLYD